MLRRIARLPLAGASVFAGLAMLVGASLADEKLGGLPSLARTIHVPELGPTETVRNVGDFNGDDKPDIIVGGNDSAFIYWGGPDSVAAPRFELVPGAGSSPGFGHSVCGVDLNNDGFADAVVGDPDAGPGKAYVYYGSSQPDPNADLTLGPTGTQTKFGFCVNTAKDYNNDGIEDLVVTSLRTTTTNKGKLYVYYGSSSPDAIADWESIPTGQQNGYLGYQAVGVSDMNGDGRDDLIAGVPQHGNPSPPWAGIGVGFFGGPSPPTNYSWTFGNTELGDAGGTAVGEAGNFDNDIDEPSGEGTTDIMISAVQPDTGEPGYVNLFVGGLNHVLDLRFVGGAQNERFGHGVASAGDLNADGYDDVMIADPWTYPDSAGAVYIFFGRPVEQRNVEVGVDEADIVLWGTEAGEFFGNATLTTIDDFTGNGTRELLIAAPGTGNVYLFDVPISPGTITWTGVADSTSWHDPGNWDLARIPIAGDDVVIPNVAVTSEVVFLTNFTSVASITSSEPLRLTGGELSITSGATFFAPLTLEAGGYLSGTGNVVIQAPMVWSGGTMSGKGKTTTNGYLTLSGSDTKELRSGRRLVVNASASWSGSGVLRHGEGGTGTAIENAIGSVFEVIGDTSTEHVTGSGDPATFNNKGTLVKSTGASTIAAIDALVLSPGTIDVRAGTLSLEGGLDNYQGSSTLLGGTFILADTLRFGGASIETNSSNVTLKSPAGAITDESGSSALDVFSSNTGQFTIEGVNLTTGTLANSGSLKVNGSTIWTMTGPYLQDEGGSTTVRDETSVLEATAVTLEAGDVFGNGDFGGPGAEVHNFGTLHPGTSPGTIEISGIYIQEDSGAYACEVGGHDITKNEFDQIRVSGPAQLSGLLELRLIEGFVPVMGDTFTVLTGTTVSGSFTEIDAFGLDVLQENLGNRIRITIQDVHVARFVGADGATWFRAENWSPAGIPGPNTDVLLDRFVRVDSVGAQAASVRLFSAGSRPSNKEMLRAARGNQGRMELTNNGTLVVDELFVEPGAVLTIDSEGSVLRPKSLTVSAGATLEWNRGTIVVDGPASSAVFVNSSLSIGRASGASRLELLNGATGFVNGATTVGKHGAAESTVLLQGAGSVLAVDSLSVGLTGIGLIRVENGAELATGSGGARSIVRVGPSGRVTGDSSIDANVISAGVVAPGLADSVGTLAIAGYYNQSSAGSLEIHLAGTSIDEFDVLNVGGPASLAGVLECSFADGYFPAPEDTFQVLTSASVSGEFDDLTGAPMTASYGAAEVVLLLDANSNVPEEDVLVFALRPSSPNPFGLRTSIRYELPQDSPVSINVYSVSGRLVRRLVDEMSQPAGRYSVSWDGRDDAGRRVGSGVYYYSLSAPPFERTRTMVLVR